MGGAWQGSVTKLLAVQRETMELGSIKEDDDHVGRERAVVTLKPMQEELKLHLCELAWRGGATETGKPRRGHA